MVVWPCKSHCINPRITKHPWWTPALQRARQQYWRAQKRVRRRSSSTAVTADNYTDLRHLRRQYAQQIKQAKKASWASFLTHITDPWGAYYKFLRGSRQRRLPLLTADLAQTNITSSILTTIRHTVARSSCPPLPTRPDTPECHTQSNTNLGRRTHGSSSPNICQESCWTRRHPAHRFSQMSRHLRAVSTAAIHKVPADLPIPHALESGRRLPASQSRQRNQSDLPLERLQGYHPAACCGKDPGAHPTEQTEC